MDIELHRCGSEDFDVSEEVDLAFTSPPYFNTVPQNRLFLLSFSFLIY